MLARRLTLIASLLCALAPLLGCGSSTPTTPAETPTDASVPLPDAAPPPDAALVAEAAAPTEAGPPPPEVTTIVVHASSTTEAMSLRGSQAPLSWEVDLPMRVTGPGEWTYVVPEVRGALEVKPRFRDTWARGPNYLAAKGKRTDLYPHFFTTAGVVTRGPVFQSAYLARPRRVWTYVPPTYVENEAARFPVLYMHDGANLFSRDTAFGGVEWRVDETMDAAAETAKIREAIVVGVESTDARIDELTPTRDASVGAGGKADDYLKMITEELKPGFDRTLRTLPGPESTGILGSSLGGLISVYAGCKQAGTFGFVGAMSPSVWWDNRMLLGVVSALGPSRPARFYVDSGDSGASQDGMADTAELARRLRGVGYADGTSLKYVVQAGAQHNETYWAERLPGALEFLLGPGR